MGIAKIISWDKTDNGTPGQFFATAAKKKRRRMRRRRV
jgi:hypothetical protein